MTATPRYRADALTAFAHALLARAGLRDDIARDVAAVLVDGDLLGHTTHGLALLAPYLAEIEKGTMAKDGRAHGRQRAARRGDVGRRPPAGTVAHAARVRRRGGDGRDLRHRHRRDPARAPHRVPRRVPEADDGPAADGAAALLRSVRVQRRAVRRRVAGVHAQSDGGGHPDVGRPDPARHLGELHDQRPDGAPLQGRRASFRIRGCRTRAGNATDDPAVLFHEPKGTLLPLGGLDAGHKGYALALLIEACTAALAGFGRADPAEGWGATVFVQVLDPAAFGGIGDYTRQTDWLVDACHGATPRPGGAARAPARRERHEALPRPAGARRRAVRRHPAVARAVEREAGRRVSQRRARLKGLTLRPLSS